MNTTAKIITSIFIILIIILFFFYLNPFGIKFGYKLSGGKEVQQEEIISTDELLKEYNDAVDTYNRYINSNNPTQKKWSETAKNKANEIAEELKLEKID